MHAWDEVYDALPRAGEGGQMDVRRAASRMSGG